MLKRLIVIFVLVAVGGTSYLIWRAMQSRPQLGSATGSLNQSPTQATKTNETPQTAAFDNSKYSLTNPNSPWVIVNKQHPLSPLKYTPSDLSSLPHGQYMRKEAADAFLTMEAAATKKHLTIHSLSGYRSYVRQISVYASETKVYGQKVAYAQSAKPGYSEHQTGWALDIGSGGCGIEDCFGNTAEGKWVAANAYKYGFIVRYPNGKQDFTGYSYEPWHIRYVGHYLSIEMHRRNIQTLEEFFNS